MEKLKKKCAFTSFSATSLLSSLFTSPDIIPSVWLGSKHQLAQQQKINPLSTPLIPPLSTPVLPLPSAHVPPPSVRAFCTDMPTQFLTSAVGIKVGAVLWRSTTAARRTVLTLDRHRSGTWENDANVVWNPRPPSALHDPDCASFNHDWVSSPPPYWGASFSLKDLWLGLFREAWNGLFGEASQLIQITDPWTMFDALSVVMCFW